MARDFESAGFVNASPDSVSNYVDDHERLSSHMTRSRGRWLIAKLASWYAAWCTQRMVKDAVAHFAPLPASTASLAPR
jgi:hypothetical protein